MKITETARVSREIAHLDPCYGMEKAKHAPIVSQIINRLSVTEILDYWCGKAWLVKKLDVLHEMKVQCYDPAIPGFTGEAVPMQMVACVDVLQDVEPECLDAVLDDLQRVTGAVGYFSIKQGDDDLIAETVGWWLDRILERFELQTLQCTPEGFYMIVYPKPKALIETLQ